MRLKLRLLLVCLRLGMARRRVLGFCIATVSLWHPSGTTDSVLLSSHRVSERLSVGGTIVVRSLRIHRRTPPERRALEIVRCV